VLIDRTSVESFYQDGKIVFVHGLKEPTKEVGLEIQGKNENVKIHVMKVYELKSIWNVH